MASTVTDLNFYKYIIYFYVFMLTYSDQSIIDVRRIFDTH